MLTIKIPVGKRLIFFLALVTLFSGCMPPGPRALLDGKQLIEEGRYPEAIEKLKVATSLLSTNAQAWNYLGLAYHRAGQAGSAEPAYLKALALNRDLAVVHYNLGCLRMEQNRLDAAKTEFVAYTTLQANVPDGWLKLGTVQLRLHELAGAEKSYSEALRINPQNAEALNGLGLVQVQRNRPREALQYFENASKQQPNYAPPLLNAAVVAQSQLNNKPLALQKYREYQVRAGNAPDREDVSSIVRTLESELSPPPPRAVSNVPPKAASPVLPSKPAAGNLATNASPSPRAVPAKISLTNGIAANGELSKVTPEQPIRAVPDVPAVSRSNTNVRIDPVTAGAGSRTNTGTVAAEKRGFLQHLNPVNLFHHETQNVSVVTVMTPEEARRWPRYNYHRFATPADGDHAAAEALFARAVQAQQTNRLAEAIQDYRQAIQKDPAYYEAYYNLGLAATAAANLPQALTSYEMALVIRPDSLDARYNFALVLKQANYVPDSVNELEKILAAYPNEPRAHLTLGNLCAQQLNQPARAREHYQKVLDADPHNAQAPAIRFWLTANSP